MPTYGNFWRQIRWLASCGQSQITFNFDWSTDIPSFDTTYLKNNTFYVKKIHLFIVVYKLAALKAESTFLKYGKCNLWLVLYISVSSK